MKKIYIPHLNYTITIKEAKNPPEELFNAVNWVESQGQYGCTMYLDKKPHPGDLSHELIHVLQFICLNRNMNFMTEHEHMGYLMHWLMGEILGYKWNIIK